MPRNVARWSPQYHRIVLATDPIAYWLQDEKLRAVSYDWVRRGQGSDQDGVYTGVTLGQPGIGDGRTSPFFDGANDFNNVFTPTFQGRFDGSEGTAMVWAKVAQPPDDPWTDGNAHTTVLLFADANNSIFPWVWDAVNNQLAWRYRAGGITKSATTVAYGGRTDWMAFALTWSVMNNELRAFVDGQQEGATQVMPVIAWAGNIITAVIGASSLVPGGVMHGYLTHAAVWSRALPPNGILHLYNEAFR